MFWPTHQLPDLEVFRVITVEALPSPDLLQHFLLRLSLLPLGPLLALPTANILLRILHRQIHLLRASQITRAIFEKTARHKRSGGISTCKNRVPATWTVRVTAGADVEDGAVDREEDGLIRIRAVKRCQLLRGQAQWALNVAQQGIGLGVPCFVAPDERVARCQVVGEGAGDAEESEEDAQDIEEGDVAGLALYGCGIVVGILG